jgi:hypothetical protein
MWGMKTPQFTLRGMFGTMLVITVGMALWSSANDATLFENAMPLRDWALTLIVGAPVVFLYTAVNRD